MTYSYGGKTATAKIIVRNDLSSIEVKNTKMYQKYTWSNAYSIVSALDENGDLLTIDKLSISGVINTNQLEA